MNSPAHALINLCLIRHDDSHRTSAGIVAGALLPDAVMIVFYLWHRVLGTPESQIWSVEYFRPAWQGFFDLFNSIPLISIALVICWVTKQPLLLVFFASMLLHCFGDLPVHHDDAHRHFYPFSEWRFISPISYWDPRHYGGLVSLVEAMAVLAGSAYLYFQHPATRWWVRGIGVVYIVYWVYVVLVWM